MVEYLLENEANVNAHDDGEMGEGGREGGREREREEGGK